MKCYKFYMCMWRLILSWVLFFVSIDFNQLFKFSKLNTALFDTNLWHGSWQIWQNFYHSKLHPTVWHKFMTWKLTNLTKFLPFKVASYSLTQIYDMEVDKFDKISTIQSCILQNQLLKLLHDVHHENFHFRYLFLRQLWPGGSICLPTLSSSRVHKFTVQRKDDGQSWAP